MTGGLWTLATIVGPILLGAFIYLGLRQSERFGRDRAAVERQQRKVRETYRDDHTGPPAMPAEPLRSRRPLMFAVSVAAMLALTFALTWFITRNATKRTDLPQTANNEASGRSLPVTMPKHDSVGVANEATCRTTPTREQAGGAHSVCADIAAQIAVMRSETSDKARPAIPGSSRGLRPGDDMPSDVRALIPLPTGVIERYPDLRDAQYFLDGQNIVVVGDQAKVEFVIDVKVRP